jgi:hypothetical protein
MSQFLKVGPNSWVRADALASVQVDDEGAVQVALVSGVVLGVRPGEDADAVCKLVGAKTAEERKKEKEKEREKEEQAAEKEREKAEHERAAAEKAAHSSHAATHAAPHSKKEK